MIYAALTIALLYLLWPGYVLTMHIVYRWPTLPAGVQGAGLPGCAVRLRAGRGAELDGVHRDLLGLATRENHHRAPAPLPGRLARQGGAVGLRSLAEPV